MPIYAKRSGIQLCYPFEEKRLEKWNPPYITQPKLDGVRCRALRHTTNDGHWTWLLVSSTEDLIISCPHIIEALEMMDIPTDILELDGELYHHGWSFEEVYSVTSRTVNIHPDYKKIQFHVFDEIVEILSQAKRLVNLNGIEFNTTITRVPHKIAFSLKDVMAHYREYLDDGYEGIIVRHFEAPYLRRRSIYMMKFKPKKSDSYLIVGYKEEIDKYGEPKGRLGALICESDGQQFSVGSGLDDSTRKRLWSIRDSLAGQYAHIEYQHITPGRGVPRFPIFVSITEKGE
jgi:ATP-dependent DNA ligase